MQLTLPFAPEPTGSLAIRGAAPAQPDPGEFTSRPDSSRCITSSGKGETHLIVGPRRSDGHVARYSNFTAARHKPKNSEAFSLIGSRANGFGKYVAASPLRRGRIAAEMCVYLLGRNAPSRP
jgi:hypothetical protein